MSEKKQGNRERATGSGAERESSPLPAAIPARCHSDTVWASSVCEAGQREDTLEGQRPKVTKFFCKRVAIEVKGRRQTARVEFLYCDGWGPPSVPTERTLEYFRTRELAARALSIELVVEGVTETRLRGGL